MLRSCLSIWALGCLLMAAGCRPEPGQNNRPDPNGHDLPPLPDTSGLRSRPREPAPGHSPAKPADTLLPEIAFEGHPPGRTLPLDKF